MEFLQLNYFSQLHDDESIVFCKTDFLEHEFKRIKDKGPVVLITGNSDYAITDDVANFCPHNVIKWYAQNAITQNERVEGIPIGIENTIPCKREGHGKVWDHAVEKPSILLDAPRREPTKDIYANFSTNTHWSRGPILDILKSQPFITCKTGLSYTEYVSDIVDHRMVACPLGNGVDTHRFWEALHLNRVPIVPRNAVHDRFSELPVIFVDDWEEVNDIDRIYDQYYNVLSNSKRMLDPEYWVAKIKGNLNARTN